MGGVDNGLTLEGLAQRLGALQQENQGGSQKMLEGVKSRGLGVRVLLVLAAMVLAIFAANALYNAPGPLGTKKAEASHIAAWGQVQGTVSFPSGIGASYATVSVY